MKGSAEIKPGVGKGIDGLAKEQWDDVVDIYSYCNLPVDILQSVNQCK